MKKLITGKLIQAGKLKDNSGEIFHGVSIDCSIEVLKSSRLPLYESVGIVAWGSSASEIMELLETGIPSKTFKEFCGLILAEINQGQAK